MTTSSWSHAGVIRSICAQTMTLPCTRTTPELFGPALLAATCLRRPRRPRRRLIQAAAPLLALAAALAGCGGGGGDDPCHGGIVINEYVREASAEGGQRLRVELHNPSSCALHSPAMTLSLASEAVDVQPRSWAPGEYLVVESALSSPVADCTACNSLRLSNRLDGSVVHEVAVPQTGADRQYAARAVDGRGAFALEEAADVTLGSANVDLGPVVKLSERAGFRPRDSSPNAMLNYDGHYWIFGGWSNFSHDVWRSVPDVWKSRDGVNWQMVNAAPPYSPYSAFLVFQDRLWALGHESYSSTDGIVWRPESLVFSLTKRAVVFRGAIYGLTSAALLRSEDGRNWTTVQDHFPWGPNRREPRLLVHRDRLWVIGGTDEPVDGPLVYRNDVWSSPDGVTWTLATANAEWEPRRWQNAISNDGLLWVMNGANFDRWPGDFGNVADIWLSDDGVRWQRAQVPRLWDARHASFVAPSRDGGFILAAGYGNGGVPTMHSDVWHVEFRPSLIMDEALLALAAARGP